MRWTEADLAAIRARQTNPVGYAKGAKFRNIPTTVDGITFDSRAEARRYGELRLLESAGSIRALELQPKFDLEVCGQHICTYIADFAYLKGERRIVEDVKSKATKTPQYRIKVKLLKALYGISVKEIA